MQDTYYLAYVSSSNISLQGASQREIKKAYRTLSLQHHPDKGGDEKTFMRISKAYAAYVLIFHMLCLKYFDRRC